jgi:predicted aspartyl protease
MDFRRRSLPLLAALAASLSLLAAPAFAAEAGRTVAFEFPQDKQILFPITINGRPAEAWLDSGSSASVVDAAFAQELGLSLEGGIRARGVSGAVGGVRLAAATLEIGGQPVPARRVAVMDLSPVTRVVPRPVQVLLGREVFETAIVQIDFANRVLSVTPRDQFKPPAAPPIPLRASGGLRSFPIRIGDTETEAILDLGNSGALLLDRSFAEAHGLLDGRRTSTQMSVGADGPRESVIASLDGVQVGGVDFRAVGAVATAGLASHAPANVGLEILSRFKVTVDFAGDRLWLEPIPGATGQPFRKNRAGLALIPDARGVRVSHVAAGSPAAAAGWRVGEEIAAIDGRSVGADYAASETARWIFGPPGRVVALTMSNGARRLLRLADYY